MKLTRQLLLKMPVAEITGKSKASGLRRAVGMLDLTSIGMGATIGTGIFVVIGHAIGRSGASVVLAFVLAALACACSALAYAELASTLPASGSAYTYAYVTLGELTAWVIGWVLILEYALSGSVVAVGWAQYINELLRTTVHTVIPAALSQPAANGGVINLPAIAIVAIVTLLLVLGVRESARANTIMVFIKVIVLLLFSVLAFTVFKTSHFTPFVEHGAGGVVSAASLIFFAYIGFEAVSTSAEEARKPQRDLPIAILLALGITTVLYCLVAVSATGAMAPNEISHLDAPLAAILSRTIGPWGSRIISIGALVAISSVVLTVLYAQTRIAFAMARDGLLPRAFATISDRTKTPVVGTLVFGVAIAIVAAFASITEAAQLVNLGTLFSFMIVNIGVLILRFTQPNLERKFRAPAIWVVAPLGVLLCGYLMNEFDLETWLGFIIWLGVGLLIYFAYGLRSSRLRHELSST